MLFLKLLLVTVVGSFFLSMLATLVLGVPIGILKAMISNERRHVDSAPPWAMTVWMVLWVVLMLVMSVMFVHEWWTDPAELQRWSDGLFSRPG